MLIKSNVPYSVSYMDLYFLVELFSLFEFTINQSMCSLHIDSGLPQDHVYHGNAAHCKEKRAKSNRNWIQVATKRAQHY